MPVLILLAEALLFSRYLIWSRNNVIPWDIRFYHLPHAVFISRAFHDGEFPLWNPFIYCGMPFAANIQAALFYPLRMLAVLGGTLFGEGSMLYWLEADWVASMFLAGLFTYLLARHLKMGRIAALMAASTYQLGGFFASQAEHIGAIEIAAWLPLVWLAVLNLQRLKYCCVLSIAFAMSILAGFTPLTVVVVMSSLLCIRLHNLPRWAGSLAFGCLLAAVAVFPAAELRGLSVSRFRTDWMGTGGGLPIAALCTLVHANAQGIPGDPTFRYFYCGLAGLGLASFGLRSRFGIVLLVSCLLMLGDTTYLGILFHGALPEFLKDAYYPQQWLAPFTLALGLCAGLGLQPLLTKHKWMAVVLPLAVIDLLWFNSARPTNLTSLTREPGVTSKAFHGSEELLATVRKAAGGNRIDTKDDSIDWVASATITGIPTAGGQDPMALISYMQVRSRFCNGKRFGVYYQVADMDSPLLDQLNVGAIVTQGRVVPRPNVLPRFYLREGSGKVRVDSYRRNSVDLTVDADAPAYMASSEVNYPGWKATVDGGPIAIQDTNGAFRGIQVPAGHHRIRYVFEPGIIYFSMALSMAAWCALTWFWLRQSKMPSWQ